MREIHKMIASVTSIIMAVMAVMEFGTIINLNVNLNYDYGEQSKNEKVEICDEPQKGYKSFEVYKGREFVKDGRVYTYSGSYTDVSNNSNLTNTYYKYYYKPQNNL